MPVLRGSRWQGKKGIFYGNECISGGDISSLCASRITSSGEQGKFAFDLQLFNNSLALVHTVGGKVTLDFRLYRDTRDYNVTDETGRVYGTGSWTDVTLVSPPEGASPIEAVVSSAKDFPGVQNVYVLTASTWGKASPAQPWEKATIWQV